MGIDVHFSSKTDEWATPQKLFDELNEEFGFDVDVCANQENHKCETWYGHTCLGFTDGLEMDWYQERYNSNVFWMNPPYGRKIIKWIEKAYIESKKGATVVCLVPAKTDTKWWHEYVMKGEIRFIRGRLRFSGSKENAPFPSAIVIFNGMG